MFEDWGNYCQSCFEAVHTTAIDELKKTAYRHFSRFNTALPDHINTIIENLVEYAREKTLERMDWMMELENPPFTINDHYFSTYREKYLARYKEARKASASRRRNARRKNLKLIVKKQAKRSIDPEDISDALSALSMAGYPGLKESDLPRLLGPDPFEEELIVMAETSAYFHVAYKVRYRSLL